MFKRPANGNCYGWLTLFASLLLMVCSVQAQQAVPFESTKSLDLGAQYSTDLKAVYAQRSATQTRYSLNGVWQVSLFEKPVSQLPPEASMGYVLVPSSWMHTDAFPIQGGKFDKGSWQGKDTWDAQPLSNFINAWYRKQFKWPDQSPGTKAYLVIDRVTMNAHIYFNGQRLGQCNEWDGPGRFEVTHLIRKDQINELLVSVNAVPQGDVKLYLGAEQTMKVKSKAQLRGLTGDVYLVCDKPSPIELKDTFIQTSVRKKQVKIQVDLYSEIETTGQIQIQIQDAAGKTAKTFAQQHTLTKGSQTVVVSDTWEDPIYWDQSNPYLYSATIRISENDQVRVESQPIQFGFRELWVDGRNILLNGNPIYFRAFHHAPHESLVSSSAARTIRKIKLYRQAGFNTIQLGSEGISRRGHAAQQYQQVLELADKQGLFVLLPLLPAYSVDWTNPQDQKIWQRNTSALISKYRNHPSVVAWSLNFNLLGYPWDMFPGGWADGYVPPDNVLNLGTKRQQASASEQYVASLDQTRIIYHHAGGNFGQMMTSNFYPNWAPADELANYPSKWAKTGNKPLMTVENGVGIVLDYLRGRVGNYNDVRWTEPLEAEYAAMFMGEQAYDMQSNDYLQLISDNATDEKTAMTDKYNVNSSYFWGHALRINEMVGQVSQLFSQRVIKSWRTYGVTGFVPHGVFKELVGKQFEPWHGPSVRYVYDDLTTPGAKPLTDYWPLDHSDLTEVGQGYAQVLSERLIYVGGSTELGFEDQTHTYFSDQTLKKQLVVINDSAKTYQQQIQWELYNPQSKTVVTHGTVDVAVEAGKRAFVPLEVALPKVSDSTELVLRLAATKDRTQPVCMLDSTVTVYPRQPKTPVSKQFLAIDPVGKTTAMLKQAGHRVASYRPGMNIADDCVLVLGQDALANQTILPAAFLDAINQGQTMLVFAQRDLSGFHLRMLDRGVRRAFLPSVAHDMLRDLSDEQLTHWRGAAGLRDPYPDKQVTTPTKYPSLPWVWGNQNNLASSAIQKPQTGAFESLIQCAFDLDYSLLMSARQGRGQIIFCQLLVESRYDVDPVATLLTDRLLNEADAMQATDHQPVYLTANNEFQELIDQWGLEYANQLTPTTKVWLATQSPDSQQQQRMRSFAQKGGTVILLGGDALQDLTWLDSKIRTGKAWRCRARVLQTHAFGSGLSLSDFNFKDDLNRYPVLASDMITPWTKPAIISSMTMGNGKFIFMSISPQDWLNRSVTPERMTRNATKTMRILSNLIDSNGGQVKGIAEYAMSNSTSQIQLPQQWQFKIDPPNKGRRLGYTKPDFDDQDWQKLRVSASWESQGVDAPNPSTPDAKRPYDGIAWYRCRVVIPSRMKGKPLQLYLGTIDDMDVTYFNGKRIGATGKNVDSYWSVQREYTLPEKLIQWDQTNTIVVKVIDEHLEGGLIDGQPLIKQLDEDHYPYITSKPIFNPYYFKRW